jgi:hypothetical protein
MIDDSSKTESPEPTTASGKCRVSLPTCWLSCHNERARPAILCSSSLLSYADWRRLSFPFPLSFAFGMASLSHLVSLSRSICLSRRSFRQLGFFVEIINVPMKQTYQLLTVNTRAPQAFPYNARTAILIFIRVHIFSGERKPIAGFFSVVMVPMWSRTN